MQKSSTSIKIILVVLLFFSSYTNQIFADENSNDPKIKFLEKKLLEIIPKYKFNKIKKSPINNIYEIVYGGEVLYITGDAKFIFESGNLQKIIKDDEQNAYYFKNITEVSAAEGRKNLLNTIPDAKLFVYGKSEKYTINVVTDIDCPYCRKFHKDIQKYIENGIKVRYLVFTVKTSSKNKVISAWCARDQNKAFTLLKEEKTLNKKSCKNPIEEHQDIISSIGVSSTPSMFLSDGSLIQGYLSPEEVMQIIKN